MNLKNFLLIIALLLFPARMLSPESLKRLEQKLAAFPVVGAVFMVVALPTIFNMFRRF